ncbi:MAG: glutathione synthase [Gammaproteobacteria bacterium RIFCSPHIGHO2_12_FULL_38_14]|nr:MAG: glutathione synthase [Gammaproteobacteria bacterium RIFCSPHIGHO2_12_FULL_38_14]
MTKKLGVVMDPIGSISYKKDSTLAMLFEASKRGYEIYYFEQHDLFLQDGVPYGDAKILRVEQNPSSWFSFYGEKRITLDMLDLILMRKDPPFNQQYIYTTYILEYAERLGVLVVNRPGSLRDANEKMFAMDFKGYIPHTLVSQSIEKLREFWKKEQDIVCKPLDTMGGTSVFRLMPHDVNANVIFSELTQDETIYIMAQKFIPEIAKGDKRILIIDGEPFSHALARVPEGHDWRGNLAVGAKGIVQELAPRDREIAEDVGRVLQSRGIYFAGIDIIGDYLTEINITSPTGIRELDDALSVNICSTLFERLEQYF